MNGEPRINIDELNRNLTMKIDELPDSSKVSMIFEDLDSKSSLASRGKKNWSEQEIIFFIWLIMNYCYLNKLNYMDLVSYQIFLSPDLLGRQTMGQDSRNFPR